MITKPLGFVNPPTWLGPSSSHGEAMVTVTWHLPLMTLCSLARGKGYFGIRVAADPIKGDVSGAGEVEVITAPKGGMGLSPIVDPLFVGSIADHIDGPTLVL